MTKPTKPTAPRMSPEVFGALERLVEIAQGDSGQCRFAANFLLAWWNAGDLGGFDFTDAWGVDEAIREDMITLFAFIARHNVYPDSYSFRPEIQAIIQKWRSATVAF